MATSSARSKRSSPELEEQEQQQDTDTDRPVAAVQRALQVLDAFRQGEATFLTAAELTARTGLPKATVLRLLATLEEQAYVVRRRSGDYHIGHKPLVLSSRFHHGMQLEDIVLPVLRDLVAATLESASYIIPKKDIRITLCRVHSPLPIRDEGGPGDVVPLERGAAGHIFRTFAGASDAQPEVRRRLVALTRGEIHPGMTGMASPVFNGQQECIGAIGLTGPDTRFSAAAIRRWEPLLLRAARTLTLRVGGDARPFDAANVAPAVQPGADPPVSG